MPVERISLLNLHITLLNPLYTYRSANCSVRRTNPIISQRHLHGLKKLFFPPLLSVSRDEVDNTTYFTNER